MPIQLLATWQNCVTVHIFAPCEVNIQFVNERDLTLHSFQANNDTTFKISGLQDAALILETDDITLVGRNWQQSGNSCETVAERTGFLTSMERSYKNHTMIW
jgi:hypothetical protein